MRHGVGDEASISCGFHWVDNGQVWLWLEPSCNSTGQMRCMHKCRNQINREAGVTPPPQKHRPFSAKRERTLPGADSSWWWPAARSKTKWSRSRSGHSREHGIFQISRHEAPRKSCGQRVSRHGQPLQRSALSRGNRQPGGPGDAKSRCIRARKLQLCGGKRGGEFFQPVSTFLPRRSGAGS